MARWRAAWAVAVVIVAASAASVAGRARLKECTNIPTQLSSHTVRARLQASPDAPEWRLRELVHDHLTPTDESAWMGLMPPPRRLRAAGAAAPAVEEEFDWAMLYRSLKGQGGSNSSVSSSSSAAAAAAGPFLEEVSLHDVRLDDDDPVYGRAQRTNLEYLLLLDVDRLVWSFRTQAGLPAPGKPYGGWESPNTELRGHFVGHYLSATARMWASTHDAALAGKMSAVVDALQECQRAAGTGYLSAFPAEFFDRFEAIQPVWAPYYTIHKIMQGLLDQHVVAGNGKALEMVVGMADYFAGRVRNVIQKYSIEQHWTSLNEETGGMNDVLYQLYTITKDQKHLVLAHLFDKPCFLGLLAVQAESLSGFHANTHIPVVIGGQMRYEVTGDPLYKTIDGRRVDLLDGRLVPGSGAAIGHVLRPRPVPSNGNPFDHWLRADENKDQARRLVERSMASSLRHFAGIGFPAGNVAAASGCFLRYTPNFCTFVALRPTKLVAAAGKPGIHAEQPPQRQQLEDEEAAPCEGQHHEPAAPALRVGIVGFGNFGQFIAAGVQRQGHAVMAASRSDYSAYCAQHGIRFFRSVDELCEEQPDVLLICSSILSTESVVRAIPFHKLRPDTIVADVLSVKQFPRNLLLEVLPPSFGIVCTHPMFGPESGKHGWGSLPFVYDKVRVSEDGDQAAKCDQFLSIFEQEDG